MIHELAEAPSRFEVLLKWPPTLTLRTIGLVVLCFGRVKNMVRQAPPRCAITCLVVVGLALGAGCDDPPAQAPSPPPVQPSAAPVDYTRPWPSQHANSKPFKCGHPDGSTESPNTTPPPPVSSATPSSAPPVRSESVQNAGAVVASFAPSFRRCYNALLRQDRDAAGGICITAKIGPAGEVVMTTTELHNGLPPSIVDCLVAVVQGASFSPPDGGGATLVIPISFAPDDGACCQR